MNRRSFLRTTAATGLACLWPHAAWPKGPKGSVVVVGAGISGLAAARVLVKAGWQVDVVEARGRIGGRMCTDTSLGLPVDLGAAWIHGPKHNPMAQIARELNIRLVSTNWELLALYDGGKRAPENDVARTSELWEALVERLARVKETDSGGDLGAAIQKVMGGMHLSAKDTRDLEWIIKANVTSEYGADPQLMSFADWNEEAELGGGDVLPATGYRPLLDFVAKGLKVHLSCPVRRIEWDENRATVVCDTGRWQADACVVTLPLGVLKKGQVTFAPALPEAHLAHIKALSMGLLDKVVLRFPRRFWPTGVQILADVSDSIFQEFIDLSEVVGAPILVGLTAGAQARAAESMSDRDAVGHAMGTLRGMCGAVIPQPSATLRTRWAADPYAHGSYSFVPVGAHLEDMRALARPLGALYFAGEATNAQYFATVHGAYLSGLRAAQAVLSGRPS